MNKKDKRVDEYIAKSADFAKPILTYLRTVVHKACPDVAETIRWGFPHFDHKGIICSMAAFKAHAAFTFWKAALMKDPHKVMEKTGGNTAMGHFGRITRLSDLPKQSILIAYVREAARLNESGAKPPSKKRSAAGAALEIPDFFSAALRSHPKAQETFDSFSPSHRREYLEWVTEAKTETTRQRRLEQTIVWLEEGKTRNWKYYKKC